MLNVHCIEHLKYGTILNSLFLCSKFVTQADLTSTANVRMVSSGPMMSAVHMEPAAVWPLMVPVRALLVYHRLGCTASQRQVRDPRNQHLIDIDEILFFSQ